MSNRPGSFERPSVDCVSIPKHHIALMQIEFRDLGVQGLGLKDLGV